MSLNHGPEDERPRERLLRLGPAALSEAELLAILLQTGTRGRSAIDTARSMLSEFKSLRGLLSADRALVCRVPGLGDAKFALLKASLELARRHYAELTPLPGNEDAQTLSLAQLQRLYYCVVSEGYGE